MNRQPRPFLAFLILGLTLAAIRILVGCSAFAPRAAGAIDVAAYDHDLDVCMAEARDAGMSLAVYERCAHEADIKHGKTTDGGAR